MNLKAVPNWYVELVNLMEKIYQHPIEVYRGFSNNVTLKSPELELYLRLMPNMWLTIATIDVGLEKQRQGIGTSIFEWCKNYCIDNGIPIIKVESVMSDSMIAFCIKHGFQLKYPEESICYDWIYTLEQRIDS
ncbi:MAG: hypothetical protein ACE3L7_32545 [Candidatus Pristimantibacillus sp.]